ncbi:hypothetical protein BDV95DRAFT_579618 [Massariosphaeria phaeospora]|uniref:Uncharacterized protein n=1 Tax=Massariosphaeria phaeospora TaxID=100035 RepID=A0A7C8I6C0_9PLEO|nr:hypothetical protein BDV95DRAFT_579618 [Massariosphaeria phaeospora]
MGGSWFSRAHAAAHNEQNMQQSPAHAAPPGENAGRGQDAEDEWYDTDSDPGPDPAPDADTVSPPPDATPKHRSKKLRTMANHPSSSLTAVGPVTPGDEAALLPYLPALFGNDLPPCGAEVQVAYENVNARLRDIWMANRGRLAVSDVCQAVQEELANQKFMYPPNSQKGQFKKRKPWRRENVFLFETRWIEYFVEEAAAYAKAMDAMTESEIINTKKQSVIPEVLGIHTDRADVHALWREWHEKKRAKTPAVPDDDTETGRSQGLDRHTI